LIEIWDIWIIIIFLNSNIMARKKKLYLVWQSSGSYDTFYNKLCGVFDSEDQAMVLKSELDEKVVSDDRCWTIMPEEVYSSWPIIDSATCDDGFDYVESYRGYTCEQRELQEKRWLLMVEMYSECEIEVINMNEAL
jgi:hypothetical protein